MDITNIEYIARRRALLAQLAYITRADGPHERLRQANTTTFCNEKK